MQHHVPNNSAHHVFDNQHGLMASYPLPQQALRRSEYAYDGSPSSNCQSWKVSCGSNYFANGSAPSYSYDDVNQLAYPSDELSSSCCGATPYNSYLLSSLTGDSQSKIGPQPAYSRSLQTESQPTCFQNRSTSLDLSSIRTPSECAPSQSSSTWCNQKAHPTVGNFPSYQSPSSGGVPLGARSSLTTWAGSSLPNRKMWPISEQRPRWSDRKTAFAAGPPVHCWNGNACSNHQQVHGSFHHEVRQQPSNVGYHGLEPFRNLNPGVCKDYHVFEASQLGEGMRVLRWDNISPPQAATGNHFVKLFQEGTLDYMCGTGENGDALCTRGGCSTSASALPTDAQMFSSPTSQNHPIDTKQSLCGMYSQNNSQSSRKRKSSEVLKFLPELTIGELNALIFAFEITERRKRKVAWLDLLSSKMRAQQQNAAAVHSNQFTTPNPSSPGTILIPERSADLVNGHHLEILDSCLPQALQDLQKDKGHNWQASRVDHLSLDANPTHYSNFKDPNNTTSISNHCAQHRNLDAYPACPRQGTQRALAPHMVDQQHCQSLAEQTTLGAGCNIADCSFSCFDSSSTGQKSFASLPATLNYLGSSQQNGGCHFPPQSLDVINTADANQTDTPDPKASATKHDEQGLKEIRALYDMLRTSYKRKMNSYSKRPKLEGGHSASVQPILSELSQMAITSSAPGSHASQGVDCQDASCPSADFQSSSRNTTIAQQVAEVLHSECSPVEPCASSSSTPPHSTAQENRNAETSPSVFEVFSGVKDAALVTPSEDTTERSLAHPLPSGSMDHANCAVCPGGARPLTPTSADALRPSGCSSEGLVNLRPPGEMDCARPPQSVSAGHITGGYLVSKRSATSGGFQETLTQPVRSEELTADAGVPLSNAEASGPEHVASDPLSERFPEQHIALPAASFKPLGAPSNRVNPLVHSREPAGLRCESSSGVSAGIHTEHQPEPSDLSTTNDSKIKNVSTEKELYPVANSEVLSAKQSDTLEFILRSLGIIPEDNDGVGAVILTSLPSGVTSPNRSTAASLPAHPPCTDAKQKQALTQPSFNTAISSEKQQVIASPDPHSIGSKVTRDWSDVASFCPGEGQQAGMVRTAVIPLQDDRTTSAVGKLKPDGAGRSISVHPPNGQAESGENPVVATGWNGAEDKPPSQEAELQSAIASLASVSVGGGQNVEETLADNLACAQTVGQYIVATSTVQMEGGTLNGVASCIENDDSIGLVSSSVSHMVSAHFVGPPLTERVEEVREALPPSSAGGGNLLKSLLSPASAPSCVQWAQLTRLKNPCSVGMNGSDNGYPLRNSSGSFSPTEEPDLTDCSGTSTTDVSLFRHEQRVADRLHDSRRTLWQRLDAVPDESTPNWTFEMLEAPLSMTHGSREGLRPNSSESLEKPMDCTPAATAGSLAGTGDSSSRGKASDCLHVMQAVLFSRVRGLKRARAASGFRSSPDYGKPNAGRLAVGQASLVQKGTLDGRPGASEHAAKGLLSGIRITFVLSLSEYWEHWKVRNSTKLISNLLLTTRRELLRSSEKGRDFPTKPTERHPDDVKGLSCGVAGAGSASEESAQRELIADLAHTQVIVPFTSDSSAQLADTNIFSIVADCCESASRPAEDVTRNPASATPASDINTLDPTSVSSTLPPGNGCCNESPAEAEEASVQSGALEVTTLNFFSKNHLRSADELEMTTESILRFWSPCEEVSGPRPPHQEKENGFTFDPGMERLHSGLELNNSPHKLNAMHCLHFGITATVDRRQLRGEKSHPNELCSAAEVVVFEEYPPEPRESTSRSSLLINEGRMGHWADTASSNATLDTDKPNACLQKSSSRITQAYGGKAEITVPVLGANSGGTNHNDECKPLNRGQQNPETSAQPFGDQEGWNEREPDMDGLSEIKIKVLKHQELKNVLFELSNIIPKALIPSPESKVAAETTEMDSTGGGPWKTSGNCDWMDAARLDAAHGQAGTSATECWSDPAIFAPTSLGTCDNSLQH
ncbi:uncharacterized protein LOC119954765 [Scyliorhinus canicula]|uniref:uncharacterized protein LOC119954765 n=1 Tax=Scyliorhinus canicula TaxID=7830 RepID=UPI0018F2A9DF|nr:uncharacterized protein LOC119954765 [Scyliorhinus canicula]